MKNYLKTFRLLRNNELLELGELSFDEVEVEKEGRIGRDIKGYVGWLGEDGTLLIQSSHGGGILYPSEDKFLMLLEVGIHSSTFFFTYSPSSDEFLKLRERYVQLLIETLSLDQERLDSSDESITYVENVMHSKRFRFKQEVVKLFLGILAYCGDSLCKAMKAEWYIDKSPNKQFDTDWIPYIKLSNGKFLSPFEDLFEGLQLNDGEFFIPMISLMPNKEGSPNNI